MRHASSSTAAGQGARRIIAGAMLAAVAMAAPTGCRPRDSDAHVRGASASSPITLDSVTMAFDYAGAEALVAALERDSLTAADVDSLLRIHGVRAMVDNVTRYVPGVGESEFRRAVQSFARTKQPSDLDRSFQLDAAWSSRRETRALVDRLRANEPTILRGILVTLAPYRPRTGAMRIGAYFVAGGVSDGFVPDDTSATNFYANLARADGDYDAVVMNAAHEAYHLMQKAAQRRVPALAAVADSMESLPGPERLLTTTLAEGTAKYVEDPDAGHWRDTRSARVRENFAVFDTVLAGLRSGGLTWDAAYQRGFTGAERQRFYFVGYEMTKAIARDCGPACVGRLFEQPPVEFFRQYVRLYRQHPDLVGRFAPATEVFLFASAPR